MYTKFDYKTKKAMMGDVAAGERVDTYQPGGFFPAQKDGEVVIEGPHEPAPHMWYASVILKDGIIVKVKG